jgi:hypothetical protein
VFDVIDSKKENTDKMFDKNDKFSKHSESDENMDTLALFNMTNQGRF